MIYVSELPNFPRSRPPLAVYNNNNVIIIPGYYNILAGRGASYRNTAATQPPPDQEKIKTRIKLKRERRTWSRAHSGHCREPVVAGGFLRRILYILLQRRYCIIRTSDGVYTNMDRARTRNNSDLCNGNKWKQWSVAVQEENPCLPMCRNVVIEVL